MINQEVEDELLKQEEKGYLYPDYDSFCFSKIPETARSVLNRCLDENPDTLPSKSFDGIDTDGIENVVLILIDGLGYGKWKDSDDTLIKNFNRNGTVTPLTSIYPSETASALVTLNTGATVAEHGVIGWNSYVEEHNIYIKTILYETQEGEDLREYGFTPDILLDNEKIRTVYQKLDDDGIDSYTFQYEDMIDSVYSRQLFRGSERVSTRNPDDTVLKLRKKIESSDSRSYFYAYLPEVDTASHKFGTESEEFETHLSMLTQPINQLVEELDEETARETLLIVTADHGHLNTDPENAIDILEHDRVLENLREFGDGSKIMPSGGPRNLHLHLKEGREQEVKRILKTELDAKIMTKRETVSNELFGPNPSERFERRVGDLIVIPRDISVWHGREEGLLEKIGIHGGLSRDEMLLPFAAARASDLK